MMGKADAVQAQGGCPDIIVEIFGERAPQACRVALCESTWNPSALSASGYYVGLFQIGRHHGWGASFDGETNTRYAYELSKGGYDWSQWSCRP